MATQIERVATLEANYKNICEDLKEIKAGIATISKNVNGLRLFKAKVIGYAAGVAGLISLLVALGFRFF